MQSSTGTALLQGHGLSTPAHHKPWAPLSVPSSWRLSPWETHKHFTRCCSSWAWMRTLCLSLVHCSQKLRKMFWSSFFHLSLLLSEGVRTDALWELLEWRLQGYEIDQKHHSNTGCRIHLEQGRERTGSRKQSWAPETPWKMCPGCGTWFSKLQHCWECAGCETEHGWILHYLPKVRHLSVCSDSWEWETPFKPHL